MHSLIELFLLPECLNVTFLEEVLKGTEAILVAFECHVELRSPLEGVHAVATSATEPSPWCRKPSGSSVIATCGQGGVLNSLPVDTIGIMPAFPLPPFAL